MSQDCSQTGWGLGLDDRRIIDHAAGRDARRPTASQRTRNQEGVETFVL